VSIEPDDSEYGRWVVVGPAWVHLSEDDVASASARFASLSFELQSAIASDARSQMMRIADAWHGCGGRAAVREASSIVGEHELNGELVAAFARALARIEVIVRDTKISANSVAAEVQRACSKIMAESVPVGQVDNRRARAVRIMSKGFRENVEMVARTVEELTAVLGFESINSERGNNEATVYFRQERPQGQGSNYLSGVPRLPGNIGGPQEVSEAPASGALQNRILNVSSAPIMEPPLKGGVDAPGALRGTPVDRIQSSSPYLLAHPVYVEGKPPLEDRPSSPIQGLKGFASSGGEAGGTRRGESGRRSGDLVSAEFELSGEDGKVGVDTFSVAPRSGTATDVPGHGEDSADIGIPLASVTGTQPSSNSPAVNAVCGASMPMGPGLTTVPPPAVPLGPPSAPPPAASGPMNASPGLAVAPATASGGSNSAAGPAPAPVPITAARAERDAIALAATANALRRKNGGKDPIRLARQIAAALNAPPSIPDMAWAFMWATGVTTDNRIVVANTYGLAYIPDGVNLPDQVCMVTADEVIPPGERARWVAHPFLALQGWAEFHDTRLKAVIGTAEQLTGIDPGVAKVIIDPADIPQDGTMRGRCRLEVIAPQAAAQLRATADQVLGELLPPAPVDNVAAADRGQQLWFEMLKPLMRSGADRESAHLEAFVGYAEHQQQSALHRAHAVADVSALRAAIADWVYWQHVSVLAADGLAQLR